MFHVEHLYFLKSFGRLSVTSVFSVVKFKSRKPLLSGRTLQFGSLTTEVTANTEKTLRISLSVTSVFSVVKFKSRQLQTPVFPFEIKKLQHHLVPTH